MKKAIFRYLAVLLFLIICRVTVQAGTVRVSVQYSNLVQMADGAVVDVRLDGVEGSAPPGKPLLPVEYITLALPPEADLATVSIREVKSDRESVPAEGMIRPAPPMGLFDQPYWGDARIVDGRDVDVYEADTLYPASTVAIDETGNMRKWKLVCVQFHPVRYNPVAGILQVCRRAVLEVSYDEQVVRSAAQPPLNDTVLDDDVLAIVDNGVQAREWYVLPEGTRAVSESNVYTIITTDAIYGQSTNLWGLVPHKASIGATVYVVTETGINGDAGQTGWNEVTGQAPDETADRIRRWLQNEYTNRYIRNVLLIGNPTPGSDVPMKMCYPRYGASSYPSYTNSPTDAYYADLTGNWDLDGDGHYGVYGGTKDGGFGGVDFYPEVYVGRIPVYGGNYAMLSNIIRKIMRYDMAVELGWRKTALLPQSFSDDTTDGAFLAECMRTNYLEAFGFDCYLQYQQGSLNATYNSVFDSDEELLNKATPNYWQANPQGLVCWWAHGWAQGAAIQGGGTLLSSTWCGMLDDRYPSVVYMASCTCSEPEDNRNLGYSLVTNGAIASVGASRVSWYRIGTWTPSMSYADNAAIGYYFMEDLVSNGYAFGRALAETKAAMGILWGGQSWMNKMDFNLYGDPAGMLLTSWGTDADGDRMEDAWEQRFGLDPSDPSDAFSDADGDGLTNYREYLNDSCPTATTAMASSYSAMTVAGSFQGWNPAASNMSLVDHYTWQALVTLTNFPAPEFKFTANGAWSVNWGDSDQTVESPPLWAMGTLSGSNIVVTNTLDGTYRVEFNEKTYWYDWHAALTNDLDDDGMDDSWEQETGLNAYNPSDASQDPDADSVVSLDEYAQATHPRRADSDFDTLPDNTDPSPTVSAYPQTSLTVQVVGSIENLSGCAWSDQAGAWGCAPGKTGVAFMVFDVSSIPDTAEVLEAALLYRAEQTGTASVLDSALIGLGALDPSLAYQCETVFAATATGTPLMVSTALFPVVSGLEEAWYANDDVEKNLAWRLGAGAWYAAVRPDGSGCWQDDCRISNVQLVVTWQNDGTWHSDYDEMAVAGTFNGWAPDANNMTLIGHGQWALTTNLNESAGFGFKLAAGNWNTNWGDDGQADLVAPYSGTVDWFGANITNQAASVGTYVFCFDEYAGTYSVTPLEQADTDQDGMSDSWEQSNGYDPYSSTDSTQDDDGDGLSTYYEYLNNGDPDSADSDGDGADDWQEAIAGTELTNAASLLDVQVVSNAVSDALDIQWQAQPDRTYDVLYADQAAGPWSGVSGQTNLSGLSGQQQVAVTNLNGVSHRIFRVRVSR